MKNELATTASNKMQLGKLTGDQIELIKNTVAKGATDDELKLFIAVANRSGLDPFTRQVHFVKRKIWNKDKRNYDEIGSIQTGIDGYRATAARTGEHAGTDDAIVEEKNGLPIKASVTVYRMIGDAVRSFTATARFNEYATYDKEGNLTGQWKRMPFLMISKCAEALALRKAFPQYLSGIYTEEEMEQADSLVEKTKKTPKTKPEDTKIVDVSVEMEPEKTNVNTIKNRIVVLMKASGLQPSVDTPEAWKEAVKKAFGFELVEENYEKIIEALEATNQAPPQG